MNAKQPEITWLQIGLLWAAVIVIGFWCFRFMSQKNGPNVETRPAAAVQQTEEDPVALVAFQVGYDFGVRYKATGFAKPTERELDEYALKVFSEVDVPPEKQGVFVTKFKRGFAWGGW